MRFLSRGSLGFLSEFRCDDPSRTPGRRDESREARDSVIGMEIEQASAKVRAKGIGDEEEDYALPIYAERIPVHTVLGAPEPCARLVPGVGRPETLAGFREGRRLDEAVSEAYGVTYSR